MPLHTVRLIALTLYLMGCFPPPLTCEEAPHLNHCALDADASVTTDTTVTTTTETTNTTETTDTTVTTDTTETTDTTVASDTSGAETDATIDTGPTCDTDCTTNVPTCRESGVCGANGQCQYPVAGDGTECDDGERCTAIDVCDEGTCVGSGTPVDAINDFASGLWADGGLSIHGLAVGDVTWLLVSFPNDTGVANAALHMHSSGGTDLTLALPNGATRGLALIRTTLRGAVQEGRIIATGDGTLLGTGLSVTSASIVVAGRASTSVQLDVSATLDSDHDFAFMATYSDEFALRHHHRIDARHPAARFIVGATGCLALVPMFGAETAAFTDGTDFERQATAPDNVTTLVWLVAVPDCGAIGTYERWLVPPPGGLGVLPAHATVLGDRGALLSLVHRGVALSKSVDGEPVASFDGDAEDGTVAWFRLDASGELVWHLSLEDSGGATLPAFFGALSGRGTAAVLAAPSTAIAHLTLPDGETMPIPGNPPLADDFAPRSWVLRVDATGEPGPLYVTGAADKDYRVLVALDEEPQSVMGPRILVAGAYGATSIGNAPHAIDLGPNGGTFAGAIDGTVAVWGRKIIEPLDGSRWLSKSLFIQSVPGTRGAIVAGDLGVPAALGLGEFPREFDPGPAPGAFVMRINSNDGVGCGP